MLNYSVMFNAMQTSYYDQQHMSYTQSFHKDDQHLYFTFEFVRSCRGYVASVIDPNTDEVIATDRISYKVVEGLTAQQLETLLKAVVDKA